jgi:hypothetical protein
MFHSEMLARTVHADRVRDLERAARDHRLISGSTDPVPASLSTTFIRPVPVARRNPCGDSANAPA